MCIMLNRSSGINSNAFLKEHTTQPMSERSPFQTDILCHFCQIFFYYFFGIPRQPKKQRKRHLEKIE